MMKHAMFSRLTSLLAIATALAVVGCDDPVADPEDTGTAGRDGGGVETDGGGSADAGARVDTGVPETAPIFRNSVGLSDEDLAMQALRLMGAPEAGGSGSCTDCHAVTRQNMRHFWDLTDAAWSDCFSDLEVETQAAAQAIVACFRDETDMFTTSHLGVFATGANFEWFQFVFRRAYGEGWETEYEAFRLRVQQPPLPHPAFTQAEFDLLTEWFLRGTPWIERILPNLDGPTECTPYVDASVAGIVAASETTGWSARNREAGVLMHGCAGAANPLECLSTYPTLTEAAIGAMREYPEGTTHRVLFTVPYRSSYWTKISADGRFVGHGGNNAGAGASIIDLQRDLVVGLDAAYDPGFFPDNSGFMFHGTPRGPALCETSVLTAGMPTRITFSEPGCSRAGSLGLYQHVGASLDGGDYFVVNSLWSGDLGNAREDPEVFVDARSRITLHRLVNTGAGFTETGMSSAIAPWQGNAVISPTMRLLVTQLATASGAPLGYVLHRIDLTRGSSGAVTGVELPEVARYCYPGSKAAFSLDDRWIVIHHRATDADAVELGFTGPSDPAFAAYRGTSNIYLIDVVTGEQSRISRVGSDQRALFPSFRSDGWLYYLVRQGGSSPEYVVATDAAIRAR